MEKYKHLLVFFVTEERIYFAVLKMPFLWPSIISLIRKKTAG